jgi:hypothetical protein
MIASAAVGGDAAAPRGDGIAMRRPAAASDASGSSGAIASNSAETGDVGGDDVGGGDVGGYDDGGHDGGGGESTASAHETFRPVASASVKLYLSGDTIRSDAIASMRQRQ